MKIDRNILAILAASTTQDAQLFLPPGQLDRKTYLAVNDVLEALGGKWNRKAKAHVFECDAADALDQILVTGEVITRKTIQQEYGYFPTPKAIVRRMLVEAAIEPGMLVLEPEAGQGAIADELQAAGARVHCIEVLDGNVAALVAKGYAPQQMDFLQVAPDARYDRIVMNPPFARQADIKHVLHALKFLKPNGRLVSVMSAGVTFRSDRLTTEFRHLVDRRDGSITPLPEGSFKESGTGVNTVIAVL